MLYQGNQICVKIEVSVGVGFFFLYIQRIKEMRDLS